MGATQPPKGGSSYSEIIEAGERAVEMMKEAVRKTHGPNVLAELGSFGSVYRIPGANGLVSITSIDGVGTRIWTSILADRPETSGAALVNHCINDIAVLGATPAYMLDYIAADIIDDVMFSRAVAGMAEACAKEGVALTGGETAGMKHFYTPGIFDLVGTIVGFAREDQLVLGKNIAPGDVAIGFASNGLHTNGYTKANEAVFEIAGLTIDDTFPWGTSVADELLAPHRCYHKPLAELMKWKRVKGAAHITGGGIAGNLVRILPEGCKVGLGTHRWPRPPIFDWILETAGQSIEDWQRTFNLGIGMVIVVDPSQVDSTMDMLEDLGETAYTIGNIVEGKRSVVYY